MIGCESHFQLLELDQTASLADMKQAYKDLVMVWHPDRFPNNARLRQKAEDKLKQFNDAYESLKLWYGNPRQSQKVRDQGSAAPHRANVSGPPPRSPRPGPVPSRHAPPPHVKTSGLYITFGHAEYVLQHYCFKPLKDMDSTHHEYQSGPFVLFVCDEPLELTLSVPCHSLDGFDRILLTIPCKSTGHFCEAEARELLQLLQIPNTN
jgi:hypothetical protein